MGLKELRDVKLQIREPLKTHLNCKQTHNTAATCPAGQYQRRGGENKTMYSWQERGKWVLWKQHPIFQRGIQHTSKAASAVSLLDLGLMDSRGAWTHTHTQAHKLTNTHTHTQNPLPQLCLIRFTTQASKALQCRLSIYPSNSPQ